MQKNANNACPSISTSCLYSIQPACILTCLSSRMHSNVKFYQLSLLLRNTSGKCYES